MKSCPTSMCAYCGSTERPERLTRDHVPPQNLFPPPRPSTLITVPSCERCRIATTKDDEYFRIKLCLSQQVGDNPQAAAMWAPIFRSFERSKARGLKKAFLSDLKLVRQLTTSGLYLGNRYAYDVNLLRIFRVISRTVRGLFFHERQQRLCTQYGVNVQSDDTLGDVAPGFLQELKSTIIEPLLQTEPQVVSHDTFFYRVHFSVEDPCVSVWALTFYNRISFLAITGSDQRGSKERCEYDPFYDTTSRLHSDG